jgi:HAE1 family hydrophobic/amphiphilic exporter-1
MLHWSIRHPWRLLATAVILLVMSVRVMGWVGSEMLPKFDSGSFEVSIDMAPGTPLEATLEAVTHAETHLLAEPSVTDISSQIGYEIGGHFLGSRGAMDTNQAQITVTMTARTERDRSIWDVMGDVRAALAEYPGAVLAITREKGGTARSTTAAPIDVRLSGRDPLVLDRLSREVLARMASIPGLVNPYANWLVDTPEVHVNVDRIRASELGLTGQQVADAVYRAMEGNAVTPYRQPYDRDLDVFVRYIEHDRLDLQALENIMLSTVHGVSVPVREVAKLEWHLGPRIVTREDYRQTLDVLGFTRGRPLSQVIGDVRAALDNLPLPAGYELDISGEQADFESARSRMLRALAFGIFAVYLVLVAQFRSFSHPATIMVAIPLQFVGVGIALLAAGKYLSMPALLGIILLTGTVVNNSIVLIDYMLQRLRAGAALDEAVTDSVAVRFRPIMMTALSDVAGMLPLALELAVGAERFSPIATVVIGGILAATLLTLVVIPVLFRYIARAQQRRAGADTFLREATFLTAPHEA